MAEDSIAFDHRATITSLIKRSGVKLSTAWWIVGFVGVVSFWYLVGQNDRSRLVLIVALSFSSFTVGAIVAFLFTSYGEEASTVGKVRDWLIGGVTGLTVAKSSSIKALLLTFAFGPGPREFAITAGTAIFFLGLGFFVMFLQRELIINVHLAEGRAKRGSIEGTKQAGIATLRLLTALPPSLLTGIDDIDERTASKGEADNLRKLLYSEDVSRFLAEAHKTATQGTALDWDIVHKVAILHYYRTYFEKGEAKDRQVGVAEEWILRALLMNPWHADLTAKYADVLHMQGNDEEAVVTLQTLLQRRDAPAYVMQWLGFFLLFIEGREDDAIRYCDEYHRRFPGEIDALFNAAAAYAQKYEDELRAAHVDSLPASENRLICLQKLQESLRNDPEWASTVLKEFTVREESFYSLAKDLDFIEIVRQASGGSLKESGDAFEEVGVS